MGGAKKTSLGSWNDWGNVHFYENFAKAGWDKNIRDPINDNSMFGTKKSGTPVKDTDPHLPVTEDPGPAPTMLGGTSDTAAQKRRRLAALRAGLLSTVRTSTAGVAGDASLLTPTAMAVGLKTRLGQ